MVLLISLLLCNFQHSISHREDLQNEDMVLLLTLLILKRMVNEIAKVHESARIRLIITTASLMDCL